MSDKDGVNQVAVQASLKSVAHNLLCSSSRSSLASISRFALMARCTRLRYNSTSENESQTEETAANRDA